MPQPSQLTITNVNPHTLEGLGNLEAIDSELGQEARKTYRIEVALDLLNVQAQGQDAAAQQALSQLAVLALYSDI